MVTFITVGVIDGKFVGIATMLVVFVVQQW